MKKRIIISIIIVILLIVGIYQIFLKKEKPEYTLAKVSRGNIVQEVSETGQLEKEKEEINLSFKSSGKIEEIYVEIGDKVEAGQVLARIDTEQLEIQLESARQKLEDTITTANEKIEKAYKDALSNLDDSHLKIYNAFNFIDLLKRTYFEKGDIQSISIAENKDTIERALNSAKFYIQEAKSSQGKEDVDIALSKVEEALLKTKTALEEARNTTEGAYEGIVPITDKNTLDTHTLNINICHSNIVSSQANISLTKVTGTAEINAARSQVLDLENQLQEATLISPTDGEITKINKRIGEISQPALAESVITLLPISSFQITVDIYEENIPKIKVGNSVDINLVAFPQETLKGKVLSIDPAEKLIEEVVYYEVTIGFEDEKKGLKPGMTADLIIKTAFKENVLIIPEEAIQRRTPTLPPPGKEKEHIFEKVMVQVFKAGQIEDREIEIGLRGSDDRLEVVSGLAEGEEVIIK